jgi:hypothetical protein
MDRRKNYKIRKHTPHISIIPDLNEPDTFHFIDRGANAVNDVN